MTMLSINLDEVERATQDIKELKNKLKKNTEYKEELKSDTSSRQQVKDYFKNLCKYLRYRSSSTKAGHVVYRVRVIDGENQGFKDKSALMYPAAYIASPGRMNSKCFNILYTSFNEYTAMMEARLFEKEVKSKFQLTKFKIPNDIGVYQLGTFSNIFFNMPRDSEEYQEQKTYFQIPTDKAFKGLSALENLLIEVLYSQEDKDYLLTSILSQAIFEVNMDVSSNRISAIRYPSQLYYDGINLAFNIESANNLEIIYTSVNVIEKIYSNKFIEYKTIQECINFDMNSEIKYKQIDVPSTFR